MLWRPTNTHPHPMRGWVVGEGVWGKVGSVWVVVEGMWVLVGMWMWMESTWKRTALGRGEVNIGMWNWSLGSGMCRRCGTK